MISKIFYIIQIEFNKTIKVDDKKWKSPMKYLHYLKGRKNI